MYHAANFLGRNKILHPNFTSYRIDTHFSNVNGPCECAIRVTAVCFIIPEDLWGRLVLSIRLQFPVRLNVCGTC